MLTPNVPYKAIAEAFILLLSSFRPTTFLMIPEIVLVTFIALPAAFLTWGIKVRDTCLKLTLESNVR